MSSEDEVKKLEKEIAATEAFIERLEEVIAMHYAYIEKLKVELARALRDSFKDQLAKDGGEW